MSISERLQIFISHTGLNLKEFSIKSAIPYRTIQGYLADERDPGPESLTKLSAQMDMNIDWLLTSEGNMFRSSSSPTLTPDETALLEAYRAADEAGRAALLITAKAMARKP
ncbi:helix-turn-helix domain-containing protein [Candidatus Magnetaquiglobus chichijimensis]